MKKTICICSIFYLRDVIQSPILLLKRKKKDKNKQKYKIYFVLTSAINMAEPGSEFLIVAMFANFISLKIKKVIMVIALEKTKN